MSSFGRLLKDENTVSILNEGLLLTNDVEQTLREFDDGPKKNKRLNELSQKAKDTYLKIRKSDVLNKECKPK